MLLQTNSYVVPTEKRAEHARLMRRFRQILNRLGCDDFEIYEQVGANWTAGQTSGRYVQLMRFRDRKHQLAVQNAERADPAAQALIAEFCALINYPLQQQQQQFAVGFYNSVLPVAPVRVRPDAAAETQAESGGDSLAAGMGIAAAAAEALDDQPADDAADADVVPAEAESEYAPDAEEPVAPGAEALSEPGVMPEQSAEPAEAPAGEFAEEFAEPTVAEPVEAASDNGNLFPAEPLSVEVVEETDEGTPVDIADAPADAEAGGHPLDAELSLDDVDFGTEDDDISRLAEELSAGEDDGHPQTRTPKNGAR
jgi:hypothetical protein